MKERLIGYGLSEKEAEIYLVCLKLGETNANRIIELSGMARGTIYDILEKLKVKGLVTSFIKDKTSYFRANDPDILIKILEEKKTNIKKILPNLKKIRGAVSSDVLIEVFEGMGGVRKILDEVLDVGESVIVMGNEKKAEEVLEHHSENFRMKRLERKIKIKNLLEDSETSRKLKDDRFSEVKYLKDLENSNSFTILYNNVTVYLILEDPITTIKINSKEHTNSQRLVFDKLWRLARK